MALLLLLLRSLRITAYSKIPSHFRVEEYAYRREKSPRFSEDMGRET